MYRNSIWIVAAFVLGAGCDETGRPDSWETYPESPECSAGLSSIVCVSGSFGDSWQIAVDDDRLTAAGVDIPGRVVVSTSLGDGSIAMLTAEPPSLVFVDGLGGADDGTPDTVALGAGFDALHADPTGRWVVASFRPGSSGTDAGVFVNPAEIAIVDREAEDDPSTDDVDERVTGFTLRGQRPTGFEFVDPVAVESQTLQALVVFAQNAVSIVDLDSLDDVTNRQRLVQLSDPAEAVSLQPRAAFMLSPSLDNARLYVQATGASQLFGIDVRPTQQAELRFDLSVNLVTTPFAPRTIHPYQLMQDGEVSDWLLVLSGGQYASFVDVQNSDVITHALGRSLTEALVWDAGDGAAPDPQVVLAGSGVDTIFFAPLAELQRRGAAAMFARRLDHTVSGLVEVPDAPNELLVTRRSNGRGIGIVDLNARAQISLASSSVISVPTVVGRQAWVTVVGEALLAWVDLDTGASGQVELPAPPSEVFVFEDAGRAVVTLPDRFGWLYSLSLEEPEVAGNAARGFFLNDIADGGPK